MKRRKKKVLVLNEERRRRRRKVKNIMFISSEATYYAHLENFAIKFRKKKENIYLKNVEMYWSV